MILDGESKPGTMDEIENNWIIEHARQVDILKLWMFMSKRYKLKTPVILCCVHVCVHYSDVYQCIWVIPFTSER